MIGRPVLALSVALVLAGCGGGGGGSSDAPKGKDTATGAGRTETPDLVLQTGRRPARHKIVLDGKQFAARHEWLLPVEIKLTNRRKRKLVVGQISADVVSGGHRYPPVYADGRAVQAPVFADRAVPPGEAAQSLVLYRLPRRTLPGAVIRVLDPARGAKYNLPLF